MSKKKGKKREKKGNETQLKVLKREVEEVKDKYLRALADYQNLEKRIKNEIVKFKKKANRELILKLLDVMDSLENAEAFVQDQGLKLIKEKFKKILEDEGVEEIKVLGEEFNPEVADCVEVVEGNKDNIVSEVVRKGYSLNKDIVREAKVKVEKKV